MIAVRVPRPFALGFVVALIGGQLALSTPGPEPAPAVMPEPSPEEPAIVVDGICDTDGVTTIVVRGFIKSRAPIDEHFSISFPGRRNIYSAIGNHEYFEVRIPREDFRDLGECQVPEWDTFSDDQLTIHWRFDFER